MSNRLVSKLDRFFLCVPDRRAPGLDAIRVIAVLLMVCAHVYGRLSTSPEIIPRALVTYGRIGLGVFFTLSGYLIGRVLWDSLSRGSFSYRNFLLNRFLRIVPASWAALLVMTLVFRSLFNREDILTSMFFVSNYAESMSEVANHYWTLCAEWHFYLAIPPLLFAFSKLFKRRVGPIVVCFAIETLVIWISRVAYFLNHGHVEMHRTHNRVDFFLLGVIAALMIEKLRDSKWVTWLAQAVPLCVIVLVIIGARSPFLEVALVMPLTALLSFAWVVYAQLPGSWLYRAGRRPWMRWLSVLSFSFYLYHMLVIYLVREFWQARPGYLQTAAVVFMASLGLALASYGLIERNVRRPADVLAQCRACWKLARNRMLAN